MNYLLEELELLKYLRNSKNISKFDKAFLDKIYSYIADVTTESFVKNKRENVESVLVNIFEMIDSEIENLNSRLVDEFDLGLIDNIKLKISELEVLKQKLKIDKKKYFDELVINADTTTQKNALLNDAYQVLGKSGLGFVPNGDLASIPVDKAFAKIYETVDIGSTIRSVERLDSEEEVIAKEIHETNKLNALLGRSIENMDTIERYFARVKKVLEIRAVVNEKEYAAADVLRRLERLERRFFKTKRTYANIKKLKVKLNTKELDVDIEREKLENAKSNLKNTEITMSRQGIGEIADEFKKIRFGNNRGLITLEDGSMPSTDGVVDINSIRDLVLLLIEQYNENIISNQKSNTEFLKRMKELVRAKISFIRGKLEVNRQHKYDELDDLIDELSYLVNRTVVKDGVLYISDDKINKSSRTAFIALLAMRLIAAVSNDLVYEELPEDIKAASNIYEAEDWYRAYTRDLYTTVDNKIKDLENDKNYSIN